MLTHLTGIVAIKKRARLITENSDVFHPVGLGFGHRMVSGLWSINLFLHKIYNPEPLSGTMPKKAKKSKESRGLNRKQIIGLGLIFIFIISTIALAVSFSGL
jgi:hypothetical protein